MSVDFNKVKELWNNISGGGLSELETLRALAHSIVTDHSDLVKAMDVVTWLESLSQLHDSFGFVPYPGGSGGTYEMTRAISHDTLVEIMNSFSDFESWQPADKQLSVVGNSLKTVVADIALSPSTLAGYISFRLEYGMPRVYAKISQTLDGGVFQLVSESRESISRLRTIVKEAIAGFNVSEQLSDFLLAVSDFYQMHGFNLTTVASSISSIQEKVHSYAGWSNQFCSKAINAVIGGPTAVLSWIRDLMSNFFDQAQDNDSTGIFSSTTVEFRHFAGGLVLETLSSVATAIGLALSAVTKVVGLVITILGVVGQAIGRFVASVATEYNDTQFGITPGRDASNAFSFVIDQGEVNDSYCSSLMRRYGYCSVTINMAVNGTYVLCYLKNPDDPDDHHILYEVHLSLNYSLIHSDWKKKDLYDYLVTEKEWFNELPAYVAAHDYSDVSGHPSGIVLEDESDNSVAIFTIPDARGSGGHIYEKSEAQRFTLPILFLSGHMMTPSALAAACYNPCSYSLVDSLKNIFTDEIQLDIMNRLSTAFMLLIYYCVAGASNVPSIGYLTYRDRSDVNIDGYGLRLLLLANMAIWPFIAQEASTATALRTFINDPTSSLNHYNSYPSSAAGAISIIYNALAYKSWCSSIDSWAEFPFAWYYSLSSEISTYWNTQGSNITSTNSGYTFLTQCAFPRGLINSFEPTKYYEAVPGWASKFVVDIPTLSFSGYLSGLAVDGLIAIGTVAVTVAAVVGYVALRNKQSQLQAIAEDKWYTYSGDFDPTDQKGNKQRWNDYKFARLKVNLLSIFTGDGSMSLGLYDEGTSYGGMVREALSGAATTVSSTGLAYDQVTLADLYELIAGSLIKQESEE